jgi:TP901 family phage tail tape measure protein
MPGFTPVEQVFTVSAAGYLAGVQEMIESTDALAASIDAATEASARLDGTGMGGAGAAAADDAAADSAKGLAESEEAVTAATDEQAAAMERLIAFTDQVSADAAAESAAMRELAASIDSTVAACDEAAVAIDRETVALKEAGDTAETTEGKTAAFGSGSKMAFLGLAAGVAFAVDKAAKFQTQMEMLSTQAGVSQGKIKGLSAGVLQLAGQVGTSPTSLAQALYHIESSFESVGITGAKAMLILKMGAEGARVGGSDLVDTQNALDAAIVSGVPGVQNYSQAMGALNAIVGQGDMTMQDLVTAMGTGIMASAKLYGQSLDQVGAALDTFGDNNIRGAKAATDLRMSWQAMLAPIKTGAPELAGLNLSMTQLGDTMEHHGLTAALAEFVDHLKAAKIPMSDWGREITDIFGKRAGAGIGVLVDQLSRVQGKLPKLAAGANEFGAAWANTQKTVGQQWADLKSSLDALAIRFGEVLLPAVTKIVGALAKFFTMLQKYPVIAAAAGAVLVLVGAFKMLEGVEAMLGVITDAEPWMWVLIAVIALAVGLYELYKHCKAVRDAVADLANFFKAAWAMAMRAAGAVITWFVNGPLAFIKQQIAAFTKWWQQNHKEIEEVAKVAWALISGIVRIAMTVMVMDIKIGLAVIVDIWQVAWGLVRDIVKTVWNVIAAYVRFAMNMVRDTIALTLDIITGHWSKAWADLKKLASDAIHGVISVISALLSGFVGTMADLGRNLILGFIHGIESMAGAVTSAAESIAKSAINAVKSALGSLSPSKKAHYEGQMFAQGLVNGMDSSHGLVGAAAGRLASAMTAGAHGSIAGGAGGAGNASVVFNLTVNGLIGNQQELATALMPVIQKATLQFQRRNSNNGLQLAGR